MSKNLCLLFILMLFAFGLSADNCRSTCSLELILSSPELASINKIETQANKLLAARPIVFINPSIISKSLEWIEINKQMEELNKQHENQIKSIHDKIADLHEKHPQCTPEIYRAMTNDLNKIIDKDMERINFENAQMGQKFEGVYKKLNIVALSIAKRLGACAIIEFSNNKFNFVEAAYDITNEAIDQLNKEYKKSHG